MPSTSTSYYTYKARAGDTWDAISYRMYEYSERYAHVLIQANPQHMGVVTFDGGELVTVPIIDTVETPATLPPWRRDDS